MGGALIGTGVLLLLFVVYQLFGTNLAESHSQTALRQAFSHQLEGHPSATRSVHRGSSSTTGSSGPSATRPGADQAAPALSGPPPAEGAAVATMHIPKIDFDKVVIQGVGTADLRQAPGHYPNTPMLGQPGNAAVAGHRTTYGAPFYRLNELTQGDSIYVTTPQGNFEYDVAKSAVVDPTDLSVLDPTQGSQLTLTTCNPRFSATQRLVVMADLVSRPAPAPLPAASPHRRPKPAVRPTLSARQGLFGQQGPLLPIVGWGLGLAVVGLLTWLVARNRHNRLHRAGTYVVGALPFLAVLFFFFSALSLLLPARY